MKELVVVSGKGGTGKTSVVAAFAALAENPVLADCDVDAADLHLILSPQIIERGDFSGGSNAVIEAVKCTGCGLCADMCRFDAILPGAGENGAYIIDEIACEGCYVCAWFCPQEAIGMVEAVNGEWFVSDTRFGPMAHAALGVAEENSGKLVTVVRDKAKKLAEKHGRELIVVDGSPGIGCPVIASLTGADIVLIITEPTLSGEHDMERVAQLIKHFGLSAAVCVNKWDINPEMTERIEILAAKTGIASVGRISYDDAVTRAQVEGLSLIEYTDNGASQDIREVWRKIKEILV